MDVNNTYTSSRVTTTPMNSKQSVGEPREWSYISGEKHTLQLKPESLQNYKRRKDGLVSREEWLSENETKISDMWQGMCNYIRDTNSTFLDSCSYVDFSNFVANYSTHFGEYYFNT